MSPPGLTPEEEAELKRRQLQELRAKQSEQSSAQSCTAGCFGLAIVFGIFVWAVSSCGGSSSSSSTSGSGNDTTSDNAPISTPNPHATTYEQGRREAKREFLGGVDESISGPMVAGNKYKYVGDDVDLHCTVDTIVDESSFNADCGEDSDGLPAIILIQYDDTSSLGKGQAVRVIGTVEDPVEGVNGFGGEGTFPTVKAEFME